MTEQMYNGDGGFRGLVNRKMEEEGMSLTQATNDLMARLKTDGRNRLEEVRDIQDMREEMGTISNDDPISRAIDRELMTAQLEKIRGNGGNGHGGFDLDKIMGFMVLQDALDNRAYNRQIRALELEAMKKRLAGDDGTPVPPELEEHLTSIRKEYEDEIAELKAKLNPPQPPRAALPFPSREEILEDIRDTMTEYAKPIYESLIEIDQRTRNGGDGPPAQNSMIDQLHSEIDAYAKQKKRIEGLLETVGPELGYSKRSGEEVLQRLAESNETIRDIRNVVDTLSYIGQELGIRDTLNQLFGEAQQAKSRAEFERQMGFERQGPPKNEREILERKLTPQEQENLRLATYDSIRGWLDAGQVTPSGYRELMEWKAILCDDHAMLATIRGKQLPRPEERPTCECGETLDENGMCPKCEQKEVVPNASG